MEKDSDIVSSSTDPRVGDIPPPLHLPSQEIVFFPPSIILVQCFTPIFWYVIPFKLKSYKNTIPSKT